MKQMKVIKQNTTEQVGSESLLAVLSEWGIQCLSAWFDAALSTTTLGFFVQHSLDGTQLDQVI